MPEISRLAVSVAPILGIKEGELISYATGFFYDYAEGLYFITNRHVVIDEEDGYFPDELRLRLHTNPENIRQNEQYPIPLYDNGNPVWLEHMNRSTEIDLVAIPMDADLINSRYVVRPFNDSDIVPPDVKIPIGQDALIIGYPKGFYDFRNNLPLTRNALVSSIYPVDFGGKPFFLIDACLHEGMSGSPVLTKPTNVSHRIDGSTSFFGGSGRMYLIGVNSAIVETDNPEENKDEEPLGLNTVWYAKLIPEIITQYSGD